MAPLHEPFPYDATNAKDDDINNIQPLGIGNKVPNGTAHLPREEVLIRLLATVPEHSSFATATMYVPKYVKLGPGAPMVMEQSRTAEVEVKMVLL